MKWLKQKTKWVIVVACLAVISILVFCFGMYLYTAYVSSYSLPESYVEITGSAVSNHYNNFISARNNNISSTKNDLIRIGDRLYFNYSGNYKTYGLYEISSDGARRIHWDGHGPWAFLGNEYHYLYPIREYHGQLLINTIVDGNYHIYNYDTQEWVLAQGSLQIYCDETESFKKTTLFGGISDINTLNYQEASFGYVYESSKQYDLWVYTEEGGSEQIATEGVYSFYATGEQIYYLVAAETDNSYELRLFNWSDHTDTVIRKWMNCTYMSDFMIEGKYLIFEADYPANNTQSLYKLDLSTPSQKEEAVYTVHQDGSNPLYIFNWNAWNNTAYLCTTKGLIACNLDTGELCELCDKNVYSCDIVDDTWIYFSELDAEGYKYLWRVRQSGGDAELVFGK